MERILSNWPDPKMVDTGELNLAVYEYGDASNPTVLMLHGFVSTGLTWHDVSTALSDRWYVIALDQRGRAMSDHPSDGDYSAEAYVRDAHAVLEKLSVTSVALVGHSMGANNSMAFASTYPEMVTSLVLVDFAPEFDVTALAQTAATIAALDRDFANWDEAGEWQKAALPLASDDAVARRLHSRMVERDGRIKWREATDLRSYQRNNQVSSEERWEKFRGVRCRTLFLLGGNSKLVSDETAEKATSIVPEGQWMRISGAGHNVFEDNSADSIAAISEFLSGDRQLA